LRALRVATPCQMSLQLVSDHDAPLRWHGLPDDVRRQVLTLLARLIARGVVAEDDPAGPRSDPGVAGGR
jgi:hypothetical protein